MDDTYLDKTPPPRPMLNAEVSLWKKKSSFAAGLLGLLWLPGLALGQEEGVQQAKPATVWQDLYYSRQEKNDLIISSDNKVPHSFYGLQIGDKKVTPEKLRPAFKFMYELKAIGNEYLLTDVVYPDYYLTLMFDEKDRLFMMIYQENQKYELQ